MKPFSSNFAQSAIYIFSVAFMLFAMSLFSQSQYAVITHIDAGNPQGLNTQRDNLTSQWTSITTGPYSTNAWSTPQTLPFAFEVYGQPVTQYRVSQNGLLTFNTGTL